MSQPPPHYQPHEPSKCPAKGKTCVICKKKGQFSGSEYETKPKVTNRSDKLQVIKMSKSINVRTIKQTHSE